MNEFQFCYWLMGMFELGNVKTISEKQVLLISEHLKLVEESKYKFCSWLKGALDFNEGKALDEIKTEKVFAVLRAEFANVIDKSYPKEFESALRSAHEGKPIVQPVAHKNEKPKFEAMC